MWPWLTALSIVGYVYATSQMAHRVRRYIHFPAWKKVERPLFSLSGLWIDSFSGESEQELVDRVIKRYAPDVVVLSGKSVDGKARVSVGAMYPHRLGTRAGAAGGIAILSQIPFASPAMRELGFDALPGGVATLVVANERVLELGVLLLEPSRDQDSFERNRISSRRLSSLMRNSFESRVVVGNFASSPFSMLSSVFNEQSRMNSMAFGGGIRQTIQVLDNTGFASGRNVFASRDMIRERFELIAEPSRKSPIVFFSVVSGPALEDIAATEQLG
jgi:hypothetical protein